MLNELVEIPVTPYVYKYLVHTYGQPPFDLAFNRHNALRMAFQFMALSATPMQKTTDSPTTLVYLQLNLGESEQLATQYKRILLIAKAGLFFHQQFVDAMLKWINYQEILASSLCLDKKQWNREIALANFLQHYDINEDEYSFDSASRQLRRQIRFSPEIEQIRSKVYRKCNFCTQQAHAYKFAKLIRQGDGYRIRFSAFSLSRGSLFAKDIRIPRNVIQSGTLEDYADKWISTINDYLLKGYCFP